MSLSRVTLVTSLTPGQSGQLEPGTGVLTLVSVLRETWDVQLVDLNRIWYAAGRDRERFDCAAAEAIARAKADVVGFSTICGTYPATIRLSRFTREALPDCRIVFGGPQASVVDVQSLETFPWIDTVIRGEAEETFPAWLRAIESGSGLEAIPGITFRAGGQVRRNPNAPVIADLDAVPLPAFDLYQGFESLHVLPLEAGRGCPYGCTFCATNDFFRRRFRLKSPARIVSQMRRLHERYGISRFDLIHDMFTVDRRKIVQFCDELAGTGFQWSCSARTDRVDRELLTRMKDSGCEGIFFGIESGSAGIQRLVGKRLDLRNALEIIETCDALGIRTTASHIAGHPEETIADFGETVDFLAEIGRLPSVAAQIHIMSPMADTPLTTQYWNELYFDEDAIDDSESGMIQDSGDTALIRDHKSIFPNFWAFPCRADRRFLRRAAGFFIYGLMKCNGLMEAIHQVAGDMLEVFRRFDADQAEVSPEYFETSEFALDLLDFAEQEFGALGDPALTVTSRFYREFLASAAAGQASGSEQREPHLSLPAGVFLVTVEGDILRVLENLRKGIKSGPEVLERSVTVAVRQTAEDSCAISELPEIALTIAGHARRHSAVTDVVEEFERRGRSFGALTPADVALHSIDRLAAAGLIQLTPASL